MPSGKSGPFWHEPTAFQWQNTGKPSELHSEAVKFWFQKGPGVIARVTPSGTQYVASVVAAAFSSHFSDIKPPQTQKDHQLSTISTVSLRRVILETLQLDKQLVTTSTTDGFLRIVVHNVSVSSSAVLSGELRGHTLADSVTFRSGHLRMEVAVRINKNPGGNPALKVENCRIHTGGIKLVTKPMDPRNGKALAVRFD